MPTYQPVPIYRDAQGREWLDAAHTQPVNRYWPGGNQQVGGPSSMPQYAGVPPNYSMPGWQPGPYGVPGGQSPFGPLAPGGYPGGEGGYMQPGQQGGGGNFWQQTAVNTGLNLLSGFLSNRAQGKADKANQKAIQDRIRQALALLSPEHINALMQQFLPQMAAMSNAAGQTTIQQVRAQAARTGQLESPRALSYEAGTRARLAGDVQNLAFTGAMNLAGQQSSAVTGAPYFPQQPRYGIAQSIQDSVNQAYFARALAGRGMNRSNAYNFNVGGPSPYDMQQTEGTPYRWPFNRGF